MEDVISDSFSLYNGDCVQLIKDVPDESVGFTIFSPPFSSLYVYSDSENDMGNCATDEEFFEHFGYLVPELLRVTKPGRNCSIHCCQLPARAQYEGYIGLRDFRGEIIKAMGSAGWVFHSEVCIWKDPVVEMQRTKSLGLLHKQMCKDSCRSRQGIPDYVCTFRKPGDNPDPVSGELDYFCGDQSTFESTGKLSIDIWQKYASPVWMDINQTRTLQYRSARDDNDERHICPLQLDVIERCMQLWSNPGDVVLSPFAGIGSEGWVALQMGRKFIGFELKESYFNLAVDNLYEQQNRQRQPSLLDKFA